MDNTIPEIKQTTIQIGDREYDGYKGPDGYYMNLSQIGRLLNKSAESTSIFFTSKGFKALYGKDLTTSIFFPTTGGKAVLVPTSAVSVFIGHWTKKGSPEALQLALELMQQNLDIRIENALGPIEAEKVAELTGQSPEWLESREGLKRVHGAFQVACERKHHPAWLVHDAITFLVTGKTAEMARKEPLVGEDDSIGLDHQPVSEDLRTIARIKLRYSGLKAGSWQDQVNRAYSAITSN